MLKKTIGWVWKKLTPGGRRRIIRLTQQKFTVSVAAVVTNENGAVLLLDHVLRPQSNWGIPGGFVEAGEQPEKAVAREIREETGLRLEDIRLIKTRTSNLHVEILFRAGATGAAAAKSREINRAGWFRVEEMPEEMNGRQKSEIRELLESEKNKTVD